MKIYYRAGFLLNDDPNGGAPAVFTQASANVADWASVIVTPQPYVARVSAPGRFVSGPSFTQTTTVALDLAAGQRFENVTLELILSDRIAYVSSTISGSPQNSVPLPLSVPVIRAHTLSDLPRCQRSCQGPRQQHAVLLLALRPRRWRQYALPQRQRVRPSPRCPGRPHRH